MIKYKVYTEVVYKENTDGTINWTGRVYNRVGTSRVIETQSGIAPSRAAAIIVAKEWSSTVLENSIT